MIDERGLSAGNGIIAATSTSAAQDAREAHRGRAREAGRKTQLNSIRRRAFRPHCPARRANDRPAHVPFASLMAVGWRAQLFESESQR
jgi:hypothetical protein